MLITLTTDFGTRDYYAGALHGAVLRHCPGAQVVVVSHEIKPYDIVQGAFVVQQTWREFPVGTLHLVAVHCIYDADVRFLAARREGHYFLAPDNGLLALIAPDWPPADVRVLPPGPAGPFPVKAVFAEASAHLLGGQPWEALGEPAGPLLQRIRIQPVITPQRIRGTVIHIDNFENAIVNIPFDEFERARRGRDFALYFRRNDPITRLSANYGAVPVGEPLCLFNSAGYLEIAVNLGRAATLLGLKVEDVVEVVFG
jgi:S-adenosylmethionine hydrolase